MLKVLTKKLKKSKGGFTLIELIVVIAILAILAIVLVPTIAGNVSKAKTASANSSAQAIFTAAQLYQNDDKVAAADLLAANTEYKDLTTAPMSKMFASKYFASIPSANIKSIDLITGEDGVIKSVQITDANGTGNYPTK